MWLQAELTEGQFKVFLKILETFTTDPVKIQGLQQSKVPSLILTQNAPTLTVFHRLAFAPHTLPLMTELEPALYAFTVIPINQPKNIGKTEGWTKLFGDQSYYDSIISGNTDVSKIG
jgi:hypothetical protein